MRKVLLRARDRFGRDQRGNVAVLFAFSAVPVIALLGGSVDLARHSRYKTQILNAMDAAAVALVRQGAKNDAEADRFVNDHIAVTVPALARSAGKNGDSRKQGGAGDPMLHLAGFDAVAVPGGYRVQSSGYIETAFMPVVGIRRLPLDLEAEVRRSGGNYEIALALDNTGSMARFGRIEALRESAGNLVDNLYKEPGAEDRVKMALVPFVTAVNIKSTNPDAFDPAWIEPTGNPQTFGFNFSEPVNRLDLFAGMGVAWKGCVEAREREDEEDTDPTGAATKWVPYLWPDEPDNGRYGNSYLRDGRGGGDLERLRDVAKYSAQRAPDTTSSGPNAACPRGIVELTTDKDRMHDEIDLMKPHNTFGGNSSGTNVAQGLLWAWRVLSPEAPFHQGAPYSDGDTTKVLVLLSDGRNQIVPNSRATRSDYTSYGYLAAGRLGSRSDYLQAERAVDAKVERVCRRIKDKDIRVYTILFQVDFDSTQDLFRECASKDDNGKPLYYYVPDSGALETAFQSIGRDLTSIHIAR